VDNLVFLKNNWWEARIHTIVVFIQAWLKC
jgi:hypothetical protein